MEQKTKINAGDGQPSILITRDFDLPVDLLFRAYVEPDIVEQWMSTKVIKLDAQRHGSFQFVTTDPKGNQHGFNGVIHECIPQERITRTFEMENSGMPVQLEFLEFDKITDDTSRLQMQIVFKSVAYRDQLLKLPFAFGINMAHDRLEHIMKSNNIITS